MARTANPENTAKRRKLILESAAKCFVQRGFHQTTMHEICAEAKMSPGGIYRYFKSKDEIIAAIAESDREENLEFIEELKKAKDKIALIARAQREYVKESSSRSDLALVIEVLAEAGRNPRVAEILKESEAELRGALIKTFKCLEKSGELSRDFKPAEAADLVLALFEGFVGRSLVAEKVDVKRLGKVAETAVLKLLRA